MMTSLSGIEAFVHTAEQRSFRRAAEQLGVSPAAVSKAVARLEEELGAALLLRTSRRVSLTPEGEVFLRHSRAAIDSLQAGRDLVARSREAPRGTVRCTLPFVLGRPVVAELGRLVGRHPLLEVELRLTDRMARLADEEIDVAVRIGDLPDSALVGRRLRDARWVTVASPPYLARRGSVARPADLADHTCVKFLRPDRRVAEWRLRSARDGPSAVVETASPIRVDQGELLVEAALAGVGVAQVFEYMVADHLAEGRLVALLPELAPPGSPVWALCLPQVRDLPRVRALLDFLEEVLGRRPDARDRRPPSPKTNLS